MKWLDRDLIAGPHLALLTTETELHQAARHLRLKRERWPLWKADPVAWVVTLTLPSGGIACLVCVNLAECEGPIDIATTLVHEAVHVWQAWCDNYAEAEPSREFEAYAIESITKHLMNAYVEQVLKRS